MSKTEKICDRLLRLRSELGKTQGEMAELLGVSRNYIYLIEKEKESAGPKFQRKLDALESKNLDGISQVDLRENHVVADWKASPDFELMEKMNRAIGKEEWAAVSEISVELQRRKVARI